MLQSFVLIGVVLAAITDRTATQDSAFSFALPAETFEDVDLNDTLSYSATLDDGSTLPAWLDFDVTNQTFSGMPVSGDAGTLNIKVTATDKGGLAVNDTFNLTVEAMNSAPTVVAAIPDQSVGEGQFLQYSVPQNTFIDNDPGDSLSLSASLEDGRVLVVGGAAFTTNRQFENTAAAEIYDPEG